MAAPPVELSPRHRRSQIRVAAAADLAGLPITGANVYAGRRFRLGEINLPCLLVYADGETSEAATMGASMGSGRCVVRELALVVEAIVAAPEQEIDDMLDRIAREVERRLYEAFSGNFPSQLAALFVESWELQETELNFENEGGRLIGASSMTWSVFYTTAENDPAEEPA